VSAVALKYPMHVYEVRPRKDKRGVDLISDALRSGCARQRFLFVHNLAKVATASFIESGLKVSNYNLERSG
jgi:hypothetical protein